MTGGMTFRGRWAEDGRTSGRNVHFGVREHGMGAILNGLAAYGGLAVGIPNQP
jgi:transketolase